MENKKLENLDLTVYHDKCTNGLDIYVIPNNKVNNVYATLTSKYGSRINEFVPIGENKMIKVPEGVAHFLEHKMFEQKNGIDPFTFYSNNGASANANTSYYKTTYLFDGPNNVKENIEFLLDYVQEPYFTDENVEKEKGIIIQEYEMYQDNPYSRGYECLLKNAFINDAIKYPIVGTKQSINSITKEDLYKCYNTFYHPSNMFLVVTGNVEPKEIIDLVNLNQNNKRFEKEKKIDIKKIKEPNNINKDYEEIKMNISIPKVFIGYKINLSKIKNIPKTKIINYICIYFEMLFGLTSKCLEDLRNNGKLHTNIELDFVEADDNLLFVISAETENYDYFIKYIDEIILNSKFTEEEFNRKKRNLIGSLISMSDNIFSINYKIMSNIIRYNTIIYDDYNNIESLDLNECNCLINNISLKNKTVCVIKSGK